MCAEMQSLLLDKFSIGTQRMKNKQKQKSTLDKMLENNTNKKNALKKIIQELDNNQNTTKKPNKLN